jgi:hypothetical protein
VEEGETYKLPDGHLNALVDAIQLILQIYLPHSSLMIWSVIQKLVHLLKSLLATVELRHDTRTGSGQSNLGRGINKE